jgi:hypothetical protein
MATLLGKNTFFKSLKILTKLLLAYMLGLGELSTKYTGSQTFHIRSRN